MTKKKMLSFSPELSQFLEGKLSVFRYPVIKQKMFGHETFFLNGYMFTGANVSGIFVHVGKDKRDEALETIPGVAPFEPMEGMVMKEYLLLHEPIYSQDGELKKWLDESSTYLMSLPPKIKKKSRA